MRKITRRGVVALAAVLGSGVGVVPASASGPVAEAAHRPRSVTVTRLVDDEGRPLVQPYQINERGQVLARIEGRHLGGWIRYYHHALWHRGEATLIEAVTPLPPDQADQIMTMPYEVSELGHVVGMRVHLSYYPFWPFLWVDGRYTSLADRPESIEGLPPDPTFLLSDVNERGEMLGTEVGQGDVPPYDPAIAVVVRDAAGVEVARNDVDGFTVDLDNRGRALVDVLDPTTGTYRAAVWDFRAGDEVTDLGTLGGRGSRGRAMNVQGHVAGVADTAAGDEHAFLWDEGGMTDLGTLGGTTSGVGDGAQRLPNHDRAESALNAWGHVVGWAETAEGAEHAVLWRDGDVVDLGTLGGTNSRATAINELGQVVGWSEVAGGTRHAFLWQDGEMTDLGALDTTAPAGSSSSAIDVNNRGQVLGTSGPGAVIWDVPRPSRP